jgi:hypothetical protein
MPDGPASGDEEEGGRNWEKMARTEWRGGCWEIRDGVAVEFDEILGCTSRGGSKGTKCQP